jgi:hypothetical protein
MISLILSLAVFCFLIDSPEGWHEERSVKRAIKGLGLILAIAAFPFEFGIGGIADVEVVE